MFLSKIMMEILLTHFHGVSVFCIISGFINFSMIYEYAVSICVCAYTVHVFIRHLVSVKLNGPNISISIILTNDKTHTLFL